MFKDALNATGGTNPINWTGGDGSLFVTGNFNGGSVKLQVSIDGVTWIDGTDDGGTVLTLAANGVLNFTVGACRMRAFHTGATPALTVSIQRR